MLAEYLEKKLDQYKIATKLADKVWEQLLVVEQKGGAIDLDDNEKDILGKIGVMDDVDQINQSLGQLQELKLKDLITSLQSIRLPDDEKSKAIGVLVSLLKSIKEDLSEQSQRLAREKGDIQNKLNTGEKKNAIVLKRQDDEIL